MIRTRAYRRTVRHNAIARKKRICLNFYGFDWYKHDGMYSKGKIHCSCKMCTYSKIFDLPTIHDKKEKELVKEAISDCFSNSPSS